MKNLLVITLLVCSIFVLSGCTKTPSLPETNVSSENTTSTTKILDSEGEVLYEIHDDAQREEKTEKDEEKEVDKSEIKKEKNMVTIKTTLGNLKIKLYTEKSPKTTKNFLDLAEKGFYNGTKFHRIIKDFMIQGGDPLSKDDSKQSLWGTGGPGYKFDDEFNDVKIVKGSLAMANSGRNTNGSQFFIVTAAATPHLDGVHTNFGEVVEGMDVLEKIGTVATGFRDVPSEDIEILSIVIE